jgi:Domain of unknown function (DUF6285)
MDDLPRGPALLSAARDVLLNDLMPLLPAERRLDALLVANCMAIAEREAEADEATVPAILRELEMLYSLERPSPSPSLPRWAPPLSRSAGEDAERRGGDEGMAEQLRRFARDLRIGAFDNSPAHEARVRAILWRLTIAKLRLANPKFLVANGFA